MTPRTYYRGLLVCALHRAHQAETASTLRDRAIGLALDRGAEPADVSAFTAPVASGALRWLRDTGRVEVEGRTRSVRHGRHEPLYRMARAEPEMPVPKPPRPRPVSMEIAAMKTQAKAQVEGSRDFYEAFAKDSARVLVSFERLLKDLRKHHARAYQAFTREQTCED